MRASRTDANQRRIVQALRKAGAAVTPLHMVGRGVADLLCSFRGHWLMIEVKTDSGTLTKDQIAWQASQRAPVRIVRNEEEAVAVLTKSATTDTKWKL